MEEVSRPSSAEPGATQESTDRRKSGRVTRKPELLSQTYEAAAGGAKRKRGTTGEDGEGAEGEDEEDSEDASESGSDDEEPDEEEFRANKRAARNKGPKKSSNPRGKSRTTPAAKKPKVARNGIGGQLALRPATIGKQRSRPRKPKVRPSLAAGERGLYGTFPVFCRLKYTNRLVTDAQCLADVFGKGGSSDTVAADWLTLYQRDQPTAMRDMVNFMLRCTGTDLEVDTPEVEDVDNAPTRIDDLQTQYHQMGFTEYPLISRAKKFRAFQPVLEEFFFSLIQTLHHSSVLYNDENLFENIQIWISALSTSSCRPFRHTSTVIALAMMNTMCGLAREVMTSVSTSRKQVDNEKKKKSVNKGRVDAIQTAIQDGEKKLEMIDEFLKDGVNIIFVHRYRDVDARVRCECMASLGGWIRNYREYFFEGQFLRYFGWLLSDPVAQTRAVVVDQLRSLYENKDNIAGLRSFTERFRQRVVEMSGHDADVGVRASAVELLGLIRDAGLIEPDDVDVVGRLVFDSEPRVRKAAGRFFVANVEDAFDSTTEELGDDINEMFGEDEDEDDFASPKRSWIKFKCLVDMLQTYDSQENDQKPDQPMVTSRGALSGTSIDSRFVLATEAIYPHFEELAQWQSLAGYLLYDHSQITEAPTEDDAAGVVRSLYKMEEGQEVILLEVLCCAVKLRVLDVAKSDIDRRGRKVKALTEKIPELQEDVAHNLAQVIPQLLNKFGSVPEAASAVLRLEHFVDLDKIQDLQKDTTAYTTLLNDINKQFLTHSDQDVLAEASVAFLHAKSSDDMREALESKVQELWDDIVDTLNALSQDEDVKDNNAISNGALSELVNTVTRVSNLASVTDCTQVLETTPASRSKGRKKTTPDAPFNTLIHLVKRALRGKEEDEETAKAEVELVTNSTRTLLFFFMWKVQSLVTALNTGKVQLTTAYFEALTKSRETFASTLVAIMQERPGLDDLRFVAITTLLDLQTLFGTLRHAGQAAENDEDTLLQTQGLVHEMDPDTQKLIAKIHDIAERTYAKKIHRPLEPAEDEDPASESDVEKEPSDDEEDEEGAEDNEGDASAAENERVRSTILAEQRLCELTGKIVLAIIGRVLDASGSRQGQLRKKLGQHKSRLGPNYREVLSFLDERKPRNARSAKSKKAAAGTKDDAAAAKGRENEHKSAERIEDDEEDHNEEEHHQMEEDEDEDLRARELVGDDQDQDNIEEVDEDEDNPPAAGPNDEDEVMGD